MKATPTGAMAEASGQATAPNLAQSITPQQPQAQAPALSGQAANTYAPAPAAAPAPVKTTPTKSTLKALPTVRDHTTDQLNAAGDEYIPRETDEFGEKKVLPNGQLLGGREYRCRTFLVPNRGDKLFMLATECARVLSYRDSYLLFNKNRSLYKIIASQVEKDDLVAQEILPFSYRSRQIAIVTARSMFRQFGSRVIVNGRRVRDDYWEAKARKQGFTENDLAGEKRPGGARAREAAAAAEAQNSVMMGGPHGEIVYSNTPAPFPGAQPQLVQPGMLGGPVGTAPRMPVITLGPDLSDTRTRDYSGILKGGPRQEITGPAYQDQTRPAAVADLNAQAHHAAEFNRGINQQRDMRNDYLSNIWRRPHEQPATTNLTPPAPPPEPTATSRPAQSPHTTAAAIPQSGVMATQSPQMMMAAPAYSQSIHSQSTMSQAPIRGMTQPSAQTSARPTPSLSSGTPGSLPQAQGYSYQSNPMWPATPQTPQHGYSTYTTQAQPPHAQQSPAPQLRHSSSAQMQPGMQFSSIPAMSQGYGAAGQTMYPADQTPRQYLPQGAQGTPAVSQPWSNQQTPAAQQWWGNPPQQ